MGIGLISMQLEEYQHSQGFTLVELVTVIVILGVLAVVGASKFATNSTFVDSQYHQEIISAFRYAQKIAIASQCDVSIALTANSYALTYSGTCSGSVKHPADQQPFSEGGMNSSITTTANTFVYDAEGNITPSTGGTVNVGSSFTITIESVTGFVHGS